MEFRLGELFCGPGGMAYGAGLAENQLSPETGDCFSIGHAWGVDKDSVAIETYNASVAERFGGEGICIDALEFCNDKIDEYEEINALAFGFPCNDFSLVGEQKGFHGDFGNLYKAGTKVINRHNPIWFIAENVSGIHSANQGKAFKKIIYELENAGIHGYNLTIHLYKFEKYGVPQCRHRYIIVGIRKDQNINFKVPEPTTADKYVTVEEVLTSPYPDDVENHIFPVQTDRVKKRLQLTPPWRNAWFLDDLLKMSNSKRRETLQEVEWYNDIFAKMTDIKIKKQIKSSRLKCTKARMSHIYKRLDGNRPSYTVTGSGGGGTHVYHWREHRSLTNRERARLQSFPDDFVFKGTKEKVRKQIGMAVPPKGAKIIFEAILKTFAGIEYPHVEASFKH